MQKLVKHLGEHLPPSMLYADDIEKLVEILSESQSPVTIETGEYSLSSVKELRELKDNIIRELTLSSSTPKVSLTFTPHHTWLFAYEDSPAAKGLFEKVKQYVLARRRRLTWTQNPFFGILLGSLFWVLPMIYGKDFVLHRVIMISLLVLCGVWVWWAVDGRTKHHSTIFPRQDRHLTANFFVTNRDKIIVAAIGALVGSLITVTLNKLLK